MANPKRVADSDSDQSSSKLAAAKKGSERDAAARAERFREMQKAALKRWRDRDSSS